MLFDVDAVFQFDRPEAMGVRPFPRFVIQQRGKDGIAVNAGHTGPYHPSCAIDQRGRLAIADRPKVEIALVPGVACFAVTDYRSAPLIHSNKGRRPMLSPA
jgi:hypothetical protein